MGVGRARGPEGLRGAIGTRGVGSGGGGCCGPGVAMGYPALHVAQQQFVPADPQEDVLTPHLPLRLQLPQPPHAVLRAAQLPLQAKGQQVLRGPRRRYGALWGAMGRYGAPRVSAGARRARGCGAGWVRCPKSRARTARWFGRSRISPPPRCSESPSASTAASPAGNAPPWGAAVGRTQRTAHSAQPHSHTAP